MHFKINVLVCLFFGETFFRNPISDEVPLPDIVVIN